MTSARLEGHQSDCAGGGLGRREHGGKGTKESEEWGRWVNPDRTLWVAHSAHTQSLHLTVPAQQSLSWEWAQLKRDLSNSWPQSGRMLWRQTLTPSPASSLEHGGCCPFGRARAWHIPWRSEDAPGVDMASMSSPLSSPRHTAPSSSPGGGNSSWTLCCALSWGLPSPQDTPGNSSVSEFGTFPGGQRTTVVETGQKHLLPWSFTTHLSILWALSRKNNHHKAI